MQRVQIEALCESLNVISTPGRSFAVNGTFTVRRSLQSTLHLEISFHFFPSANDQLKSSLSFRIRSNGLVSNPDWRCLTLGVLLETMVYNALKIQFINEVFIVRDFEIGSFHSGLGWCGGKKPPPQKPTSVFILGCIFMST